MSEAIQHRLTVSDFLALPETSTPTELIHGEIIVSPSARLDHQRVVVALIHLLAALTDKGEIMTAPMDVHLDQHNVVQPDVFWVSGQDSLCQSAEDGYWHGAPDLVIEALSPATARQDRGTKFDLYQTHGTREYWIIDPAATYIEVYVRQEDQFSRLGIFGPEQTFSSPVLGNKTVIVDRVLK